MLVKNTANGAVNPVKPDDQAASDQKTTDAQAASGQKMVPLTALQEERAKLKELRDEVDALKAAQSHQTFSHAAQPSIHQGSNIPQQDATATNLDRLWEEDPKAAFRQEMSLAFSWYDKANVALDSQEEEVASKHADFATYRGEVKKYLRGLAPHQRTSPGVVEMAYYLVKGQKTDDLVNLSKEQLIAKIKAGENVQGVPMGSYTSPPEVPVDTQPSAQQAAVARAMGLTTEQYMKNLDPRVGR